MGFQVRHTLHMVKMVGFLKNNLQVLTCFLDISTFLPRKCQAHLSKNLKATRHCTSPECSHESLMARINNSVINCSQ